MVNSEMLLSKDVFSTSWVKVDGVEYKGGLVVCSSMEEDMPVFCQIRDVLLVEDDIYFLTKKAIYRDVCGTPPCLQSFAN